MKAILVAGSLGVLTLLCAALTAQPRTGDGIRGAREGRTGVEERKPARPDGAKQVAR
jgi:hypothetical protein